VFFVLKEAPLDGHVFVTIGISLNNSLMLAQGAGITQASSTVLM
jgi:hypothetical protein